MIDKGITTLGSLTPKKSLKPTPGSNIQRGEIGTEIVTNYVEMWTGQYMEGVADDDADLPYEERKKYAIPRMTKVPFEAHINNGGDLQIYFEKGWCLKKDMPEKAKKFLEIANNRFRSADEKKTLTPEEIVGQNKETKKTIDDKSKDSK